MSLYGDYIKEHAGDSILEMPWGFATYRFLNFKQCYIEHIYVIPSERKKHRTVEMSDMICAEAKAIGCEELLGSVCTVAKDPTASIKVLLGHGMSFSHVEGNLLIFKKDIK